MILEFGNMWKMWGKTDLFVITGNASLRQDGCPVMGRGIAKEFRDRFPNVLGDIGYLIEGRIYINPYYGLLTYKTDNQKFGLFQVKRWWHEKASLSIVERSTYELLALAEANKNWRIDVNYPAIGYGGRTIEEIEPIINVLPDNVHVWQKYRRRRLMEWGKGDPDKVRPSYDDEGLDFLDLPDNVMKTIRLIGDPVIWYAHWISIWSTDGEIRVPQPMCCVKFDTEEFINNADAECVLCAEDDELPEGTSYERDYDRGPDFRGFALCIDREAQEAGKPYIKSWGFPITAYDAIETYAQKWGDPADAEEGYDVTVQKVKKEFTKYKVTPERETSSLSEDETEAYEKALPAFQDLYELRDNDKILERIQGIIKSLDSRDEDKEEKPRRKKPKKEDESEEEEEKPSGEKPAKPPKITDKDVDDMFKKLGLDDDE